jgi:HAD superfamily hydrolase (TIGR01549 family)
LEKIFHGVLLDFDGTLVKLVIDWPAMKRNMNFDTDSVSILDFLTTAPSYRAHQIAMVLERHERAAAERAEVNEGAVELLEFLATKNIPFCVVTNNAMRHISLMLQRTGLSIDKIITRDIGYWKPDVRQVLAGAKAIDVPPEMCIFIGDGQYDMMAAREAGMISVHLASEPGPSCDYRVERLGEVISLLKRLLS